MALINIHQLLRLLEFCGTFTSTWPSESTIGKREMFYRDLIWLLTIINFLAAITPLSCGIWYLENDFMRVMKALSELTALLEALFNLILCRIGRSRLQRILANLNDFLAHSEPHERRIIQKYLNRYSGFCLFVAFSYVMTAVTFSSGPLFLSVYLPIEIHWYPFSIEPPYIRALLYAQHVLVITQAGTCISVDFMIALFLMYPSARLEMLGEELQQVTHQSQMKRCIRKHQEIISFVDEVQSAVRYLLCKINLTMAFAVICGAFPLVYKQPFTTTAQFLFMVLCGCQRLYVTAWPADDLSETSQQIAWSAYNMTWYERPREVVTNLFIFIQRSKKPIFISMGGIFPVLSLQYYVNFIKAVSSYFMTMRATIGE